MTAPVSPRKTPAEILPMLPAVEAELYIAGGWVMVDGSGGGAAVHGCQSKGFELTPEASLTAARNPVTIMLHNRLIQA